MCRLTLAGTIQEGSNNLQRSGKRGLGEWTRSLPLLLLVTLTHAMATSHVHYCHKHSLLLWRQTSLSLSLSRSFTRFTNSNDFMKQQTRTECSRQNAAKSNSHLIYLTWDCSVYVVLKWRNFIWSTKLRKPV